MLAPNPNQGIPRGSDQNKPKPPLDSAAANIPDEQRNPIQEQTPGQGIPAEGSQQQPQIEQGASNNLTNQQRNISRVQTTPRKNASKEEEDVSKLEKGGKAVQAAGAATQATGAAAQATGATAEAVGKGMEVAGKAVTRAGTAMTRAGAAMSGTVVGAIAGVPLAALGVATTGAGAATQGAGKVTRVVGKTTKKAGKGVRKAGKGVSDVGKGINRVGRLRTIAKRGGAGKNDPKVKALKIASKAAPAPLKVPLKLVADNAEKIPAGMVTIEVLSWAGPMWFWLQLPLAIVAAIMFGATSLAYSLVEADADAGLLERVGTAIVSAIASALNSVAESLFGISLDPGTYWYMLQVGVFILSFGTIVVMTIQYTLAGVNCFLGKGSLLKIAAFVACFVGSLFPIVNIFPWFALWAGAIVLNPE